MAEDRIIPDRGQQVGIPGQWTENWPDGENHFVTGNEPAVMTMDAQFPADIDWPALTPVGRDATTKVLKAAAVGEPCIGVTIKPMKIAAGKTGVYGAIYRAGCFDPNLMQWPAAFDTRAKKMAAFEGAPTPTNIKLQEKHQYSERTTDYFAS